MKTERPPDPPESPDRHLVTNVAAPPAVLELAVDLHAIAAAHARPTDAVIERGAVAGLTLGELLQRDHAAEWIRWALGMPSGHWSIGFQRALELVAAERAGES